MRLATPALSAFAAATLALLAGCTTPTAPPESDMWGARIASAAQPLQCVEYARSVTNIALRGDAWTWWGQAESRYARGHVPRPGSVLVLGPKGASAGHVAVVTRVVSDRVIVASHANWLNRGHIHENTPIRDVSARGDWSAVRVWYTPGGVWGRSTYPAYGFIYPRTAAVAARHGG